MSSSGNSVMSVSRYPEATPMDHILYRADERFERKSELAESPFVETLSLIHI